MSTTKKSIKSSEAWKKGDLFYKLRPVQQKMHRIFYESDQLKVVLNCSRRIGKTYLSVAVAIEHCQKDPEAQVRFACASRRALKKIVLPVFRTILKDCPYHLRPKFNSVESVYTFPNGAEIHLEGCSNGHEENLRGTAATLCIVTEAGTVRNLSYVVDDILMPQLLTSVENGKEAKLLMESTPPRTPAHDFQEYCMQAQLDGAYAEFDINQSGYAQSTIDLFIKEAGGLESTTAQREYFCKFVVDSDYAIIPEWDDKFIGEPDRASAYYPLWHKYDAMDTGFRDFTAILYSHYNFKEACLYIERESTIHGPTMTTKLIADTVRPIEKELWGDSKVYRRIADNNDPIVLQDLSVTHEVNFAPTDKESLQAMVNKVREWVKSGRVRISPNCKYLLGCLKYGVWDENRKQFERTKVYKHFDHLAALVYLIRNIDESSNPIPHAFGVDRANTYVRPNQNISKLGKAFKNTYGTKFRDS